MLPYQFLFVLGQLLYRWFFRNSRFGIQIVKVFFSPGTDLGLEQNVYLLYGSCKDITYTLTL